MGKYIVRNYVAMGNMNINSKKFYSIWKFSSMCWCEQENKELNVIKLGDCYKNYVELRRKANIEPKKLEKYPHSQKINKVKNHILISPWLRLHIKDLK